MKLLVVVMMVHINASSEVVEAIPQTLQTCDGDPSTKWLEQSSILHGGPKLGVVCLVVFLLGFPVGSYLLTIGLRFWQKDARIHPGGQVKSDDDVDTRSMTEKVSKKIMDMYDVRSPAPIFEVHSDSSENFLLAGGQCKEIEDDVSSLASSESPIIPSRKSSLGCSSSAALLLDSDSTHAGPAPVDSPGPVEAVQRKRKSTRHKSKTHGDGKGNKSRGRGKKSKRKTSLRKDSNGRDGDNWINSVVKWQVEESFYYARILQYDVSLKFAYKMQFDKDMYPQEWLKLDAHSMTFTDQFGHTGPFELTHELRSPHPVKDEQHGFQAPENPDTREFHAPPQPERIPRYLVDTPEPLEESTDNGGSDARAAAAAPPSETDKPQYLDMEREPPATIDASVGQPSRRQPSRTDFSPMPKESSTPGGSVASSTEMPRERLVMQPPAHSSPTITDTSQDKNTGSRFVDGFATTHAAEPEEMRRRIPAPSWTERQGANKAMYSRAAGRKGSWERRQHGQRGHHNSHAQRRFNKRMDRRGGNERDHRGRNHRRSQRDGINNSRQQSHRHNNDRGWRNPYRNHQSPSQMRYQDNDMRRKQNGHPPRNTSPVRRANTAARNNQQAMTPEGDPFMLDEQGLFSNAFIEALHKIFLHYSHNSTSIPFSRWSDIVSFANPHLEKKEVDVCVKSARDYFDKMDLPSAGQVTFGAFKAFYTDGASERPQSVLHDMSKHGYKFKYRPQCPEIPDQYQEFSTPPQGFGAPVPVHASVIVSNGGLVRDASGLMRATSEQFAVPYTMTGLPPGYCDPNSARGNVLQQTPPRNWVPGSNLRRSESEATSLPAPPIVIPSEPRTYPRDMDTQPEHQNPIVPQDNMQQPRTVHTYIPSMIIGGNGNPSPDPRVYQYAYTPVPTNVTYTPYPATTYMTYPWAYQAPPPPPTAKSQPEPTAQSPPEPQGQYRTDG